MSCKRLKRTALALEDLEPALWGTLAPRLLNLVFLRLPVAQISQLRLLSKLWKASVDSVESDFNLLLEDKVYPNLFGFIGWQKLSQWGGSCVWMFDVNQDRWCNREINRSVYGKYVGAADGGLVCFVSNTTKDPLIIVVVNPLTGKKVELPRLLCIYDVLPTIQPSMLQLKMNRKNNQYVVFFVGYVQSGNRGLLAQVYDSRTKEWSMVGSREKSLGRISGYSYAWKNVGSFYDGEREGPCLYDFAQGQRRRYKAYEILRARLTMSYAMLWDRLFILHMHKEKLGRPSNLIQKGPEHKYFISEYHLQQNGAAWVKGGIHGCEPFDDYPQEDYLFVLHACNGYLVVMAHCDKRSPVGPDYTHCKHRHDIVWLYNLSTYKWHVHPNVPGLDNCSCEENFMCELRWSATP